MLLILGTLFLEDCMTDLVCEPVDLTDPTYEFRSTTATIETYLQPFYYGIRAVQCYQYVVL